MTLPLISCIVPVFNGERYLGESLDSILAQTYHPLELIVVDDGSTDSTAELVAQYADRVTYIAQANQGTAAARNRGLTAARGELIAFNDADDLWHPEKLERQWARLQACPELDMCLSHIQNFWTPELADEEKHLGEHRRAQAVPGYSAVTLLARRNLFDRVGPFDSTLRHGDTLEWFLRALEGAATVQVLPEVLAYRRLHPNNLSRLKRSASLDANLLQIRAMLHRRRQSSKETSQPSIELTSDPDEDH